MAGSSGCRVELTRQARKDLDKLAKKNPAASAAADAALLALEEGRRTGHSLSGDLAGCRALEFSVRGSGQYRAVYVPVDEATVCVVIVVATHENVYEEARRRARQVLRDSMGA